VDAERFRLVAKMCRQIGTGAPLEVAVDALRAEWREFCKQQDVKIAAAPKIKHGPMAGISAIHYKHADPGVIDDDIVYVRQCMGR